MENFEETPHPVEDMAHAHMLLARMTPEELLRATYALEEIVEHSASFQEEMRAVYEESKNGPWVTTEELIESLGFDKKDFPGLVEQPVPHEEAA